MTNKETTARPRPLRAWNQLRLVCGHQNRTLRRGSLEEAIHFFRFSSFYCSDRTRRSLGLHAIRRTDRSRDAAPLRWSIIDLLRGFISECATFLPETLD